MHLTQLREKIADLLARHGDTKMQRVLLVGPDDSALLAYKDSTYVQGDPPAETATLRPVTIDEAEDIEERFENADVDAVIPVTYDELAQLLEYKAELMESYKTKAAIAEPPAAGKGPELVSTNLKDAEQQLGETMAKVDRAKQAERKAAQQGAAGVAADLEGKGGTVAALAASGRAPAGIPDLEGKGTEVRMPCPQSDSNKVGCVREFGHDGDHQFTPCNHVDVRQGACTLWYGHEGEHVWINPAAAEQGGIAGAAGTDPAKSEG